MHTVSLAGNYKIAVEDCDCVRSDESVMKIRLSHPLGTGPFPAVVDIHGGGWVAGDRNKNAVIDDTLASHGIVVAAPEFRMPPEARYPVPITDVHLAIRWLKANATGLGSRADLVGGLEHRVAGINCLNAFYAQIMSHMRHLRQKNQPVMRAFDTPFCVGPSQIRCDAFILHEKERSISFSMHMRLIGQANRQWLMAILNV